MSSTDSAAGPAYAYKYTIKPLSLKFNKRIPLNAFRCLVIRVRHIRNCVPRMVLKYWIKTGTGSNRYAVSERIEINRSERSTSNSKLTNNDDVY